jgi:IS5 family transposase
MIIKLSEAIDWVRLEDGLSHLYSSKGRQAKPIRLMAGLLILKQLYGFSDETVVLQVKMNPYFQHFCGFTTFQIKVPCHSSELTKFRNRMGEEGISEIFKASVSIHGKAAEEKIVLVDSTVQEKNITYPTDVKMAIKIINIINKMSKFYGISQRRTYAKDVKNLRIRSRLNHRKTNQADASKALKALRNIANILIRELARKLPRSIRKECAESFDLYIKILKQQPKDKNKVYALHEPHVYCVGKGKPYKKWEYGVKASIACTLNSKIIVGVLAHETHENDSKLLKPIVEEAEKNRQTPIETVVADRGYRGSKRSVDCEVIIPETPLKRDTAKQRKRKQILCRKRSGIEPVIGHLKNHCGLRNTLLKGFVGDSINLLMAACVWNLKKWMSIFLFLINWLFSAKFGIYFDQKLIKINKKSRAKIISSIFQY